MSHINIELAGGYSTSYQQIELYGFYLSCCRRRVVTGEILHIRIDVEYHGSPQRCLPSR